MGIHLEGPFLGEKYKGAMPSHLLRDMDLELLKRYQQAAEGEIRYITVSPERAGVLAAIPEIRKMGIQVTIGHSDATYDQAMQAIRQGAGACTHTFNAMRLFHQHEPAIMGAALESDIYCEAICDGIHLASWICTSAAENKELEQGCGGGGFHYGNRFPGWTV